MADIPVATFSPSPCYNDPMTAFDWLQQAFGFEPLMLITDSDGKLGHAELRYGAGVIMVGWPWTEKHASPLSVGGKNTQTIHVHLQEDVNAHCERARAAGAVIEQEPEDQFYGARTYRARDPEGHLWTFSQEVQTVSPEEWDKASGLKTKIWS